MSLSKQNLIFIIFGTLFFAFFVSANITASVIAPRLLEKECEKILGVPVFVKKVDVNFLNASFSLRDVQVVNTSEMEEKYFLTAKNVSVNFSFTSLLARQLIFEKIRLEEPVLNLERSVSGRLNLNELQENIQNRFVTRIRLGKRHFFTGYEINQFAIKQGKFRYLNRVSNEGVRKISLHHLDFSFSNFSYPPQVVDPIPTSLHFNAKSDGLREASILVLGTGNFFAGQRTFKVRSDFKDFSLRDLNFFIPEFPLQMTDGFIDWKSTVSSQDDLLKMESQFVIENLKLAEKPGFSKIKTVFGFPKKDIIDLFLTMQGRPFDFDFSVSSDLNDPTLRLDEKIRGEISAAIQKQLNRVFEKLKQSAMEADGEMQGSDQSQDSFRKTLEQWTGIKLVNS